MSCFASMERAKACSWRSSTVSITATMVLGAEIELIRGLSCSGRVHAESFQLWFVEVQRFHGLKYRREKMASASIVELGSLLSSPNWIPENTMRDWVVV